MKDQWGHEVVDSETQRLRAELTEVKKERDELAVETKKQKGIIFGERKFSESLCNDLRIKLAEVEKERDKLKNTLKLIGNLLEEKLFAADDAVFVIKKTLAKLEG